MADLPDDTSIGEAIRIKLPGHREYWAAWTQVFVSGLVETVGNLRTLQEPEWLTFREKLPVTVLSAVGTLRRKTVVERPKRPASAHVQSPKRSCQAAGSYAEIDYQADACVALNSQARSGVELPSYTPASSSIVSSETPVRVTPAPPGEAESNPWANLPSQAQNSSSGSSPDSNWESQAQRQAQRTADSGVEFDRYRRRFIRVPGSESLTHDRIRQLISEHEVDYVCHETVPMRDYYICPTGGCVVWVVLASFVAMPCLNCTGGPLARLLGNVGAAWITSQYGPGQPSTWTGTAPS